MSVDDLGDELAELRELKRRVDRLESGSMLENSSITRGRMRFIGGTLRVDSGGRVEIVGTLQIEGTTTMIGPVTISGTLDITGDTTVTGQFDVNGPWALNGDGDITGNVDLTGSLGVLGLGQIKVGSEIQIDATNGGRISIGGSSGPMVLSDSQIAFDNGSAISEGGTGVLIATPGDLQLFGQSGTVVSGLPDLTPGTTAYYVVADTNGRLYLSSGVGGGGGTPTPGTDLGNFQWPFPLSSVTSEYGPRTSPYTGFHEGIDFGISPAVAGAPIIAAGDGTIAVNTFSAGWGNYVRITHTLTDGTQVSTLYAHMNAPGLPAVGSSVTKGDVIGYVGNTGNSYGAHLHFETWMTTSYGSHVNPRDFMAAYGPA